MRTSVEHETDEKAPARGGEAHRRDSGPSGSLDARMLLGLQATAGNAAVADLIETRKPPAISPPPLKTPDIAPPSLTTLDAEADPTVSISSPYLEEGDTEEASPSPLAEEGTVGADPGTSIE